ncbi:CD82 molecule a isoform X3 [Triplophysa rosa]|uniref:CD82 molecule a isoform X3 n=1 Tax=Triplophysa rosa TaxID=992332 RepID=UPI0025460CC1|nr:CD82 molecule a isoform X3 [Triplophysa rosa]
MITSGHMTAHCIRSTHSHTITQTAPQGSAPHCSIVCQAVCAKVVFAGEPLRYSEDSQSDEDSSIALKVATYILIGVGSFSMILGFLGCLGTIYEIRCLLGFYFTCLLVILLAQVAAAVLIYFQRDVLRKETTEIVSKITVNYPGQNKTAEQAWDYIQRTILPSLLLMLQIVASARPHLRTGPPMRWAAWRTWRAGSSQIMESFLESALVWLSLSSSV